MLLKQLLTLQKIKATAKDIDKEIENMAKMYQMEVDKIKEMFGDSEKKQIGEDLAVQKAVDFVVKKCSRSRATQKKTKKRNNTIQKRMEVSRNGISTLRD